MATRMRKATTYLILWILLLVPTAFAALALVATFAYAPEPALRNLVAAVWGTCLILFGGPLLVFLFLWWRHHATDLELQRVGAILRAYDSLPLRALAERVGKDQDEAERLAGAAIREGYARGFIDNASRSFRNTEREVPPAPPMPAETAQARPSVAPGGVGGPAMRYCRKCGNRVYPREGGRAWQCWNCGNVQSVED